MKKIILYIAGFLLLMVSCQEEFEPGSVATKEYSGEWYYQILGPDMSLWVDYDYESSMFLTYSTADNEPNELWFDDQGELLYMKCKIPLSGTAANFSGTALGLNEYEIGDPEGTGVDGEIYMDTVDYALVEVIEGKIIKNGATVEPDPEKTVTDSIYIKFKFSSAALRYISRVTYHHDEDGVIDDTIYHTERAADFYEELDILDTIIISGHKQTGWEVYF